MLCPVCHIDIMALRLFWLGVVEATRPESCPLFFQVDLAHPILRFTCRPEGGCYSGWMKRADLIVCPVHLWFLSVLPLLSDTTQLRAMLDTRDEHGISKDGLALAVLAFSTTVCIFCLQCVRVVWPNGFEGESHSMISIVLSNALLGTILHSPFTLNAVMWLAHYICLVRMIL